MAPCMAGGAPAAALAAAQAAELAARLRARSDSVDLSTGEVGRRLSALPTPPGTLDLRPEELDTAPAPLPRLGGGEAAERRRKNGYHPAGLNMGLGPLWPQAQSDQLSGSLPLEPTTTTLVSPVLPEVPPASVPRLNLEVAGLNSWNSRQELPSERATSDGRPSQAGTLPPPPAVLSGRGVNSVPASRRGRSRPTSPMRSEYQWLEVPGSLPPVPPTALWFASKAEELERRRSRSAERQVFSSQGPSMDGMGYAAVWPPPPLPPVSEDLRQRLEQLEAQRVAERDTLARTVEELTTELRGRGDQQKMKTLEVELEHLRSQEKMLQAEVSSSKLREEDAKKQLHRVEADRVRLETLIVTVEQQCSDLRQELHDAKGRSSGDWQRLQESLKDLEAERDRLRRSYGDSERLLVDAHAAHDALGDEIHQLKDFKQRAIKAEHQLRELQEQLEDHVSSEGRQLQVEKHQVRSLTQETESLKVQVQSLKSRNMELEKDQRAWQKAEEESRKAAAALRKEVEKLREERQDLDRQVKEMPGRRSRTSHVTVQPRPPDSGSSAHRSTIVEVDLRNEGNPHMEEKEVDDSDSSDEYYEQEPPTHIKERLAGLQPRLGVRQDLR